jgi:hypothetical protein
VSVAGKSRKSIDAKIKACVAQCLRADLPLACLAEFVSQLRQDGWSAQDVHEVELAVLKVLARILSGEENGDENLDPSAQ